MKSRVVPSLVAVCLLLGCAPDGSAYLRSSRQAIVDGTLERGEPAVVVVKAFSGVGLCTGTLITERVVLTAKHCVQAPDADRPYPASTLEVGFGWQAGSTTDVRAMSLATTPGVYTSSSATGIGGALVGIDVGVITLREPITDVTPIPVGRAPATDFAGQEFTAIGFGQTEGGGSGTKYKTTSTVAAVSGGVIFTSRTICQGDSGGPMIIEGAGPEERRVIGVASFGEAGSCPSSRDGYNRVDEFLGLIDQAIIASGGCPEATDEVCNSIDDDCDGTIDEGCARIGEACESDTDCAFAQLPERFEPLERPVFCGETAAGRVCTRTCDPLAPRAGCGEIPHPFLDTSETVEGAYCQSTGGCEGLCAAGEAGSGGDGDACERDTDCQSLFCADPGDGRKRCLTPCRGGDGICFAGEVCAASGGACGGCLPPDMVSGSRALGEPCADGADCGSGLCLEDGGFLYCSRACEDDAGCAAGFHCRAGTCARGARSETGERCVTDEDCVAGDLCAEDEARRWCTHACTTGTSCPEGFLCVGNECVPHLRLDGEACSDDDQCISGVCGSAGDRRRCLRPCGAGAPCPSGLECRRLGDSPDATCAPPFEPEPGGCTVTPAPHPRRFAWLLPLLLTLPILRRRPRNP